MIYLIAFIITTYFIQLLWVACDLSMGKEGLLDKKTINILLLPLGFVCILYRMYQERE